MTLFPVRPRTAFTMLIALGVLVAPATAASASPPPTSSDRSCWQDLDTGAVECFDSSIDPVAYIEHATGGPVVAEQGAHSVGQRRTAAMATYLLTTLYDQVGRTGASVSYTTSNPSICSGVTHFVNNLREWNDRARSLQSFNGCRTTVYSESNTLGTSAGPFTTSNDLGAFRDITSSVRAAA